MAYTRWSDNQFYTFWSTDGNGKSKMEQVLRTMVDCDHDYGYTYEFIKTTGCAKAATHLIEQYQQDSGVNLPEDSATNLAGIFETFIKDVDGEYPNR